MKSLTFVIALILAFSVSGQNSGDPILDGKMLFVNNCKACHHLEMRLVGPPLLGVTEKKDISWLIKFVKSAATVIQSGDMYADSLFKEYYQIMMPDQNLDTAQILAIFDYIESESKEKVEIVAISRPEVKKSNMVPLAFTDFRWWIIFTISLFLLIIGLHKLVELDELMRMK